MKIFDWATKVSKEDPMQQYDFRRFEDQCGDFYLIEARLKFVLLEEIKDKKIVYLQVEEPNRFMCPDPVFRGDEYDTYFYKVLTVCPYTAQWYNKIQGTNRREVVFIPVNEKKIPARQEKKYDIAYVGNINSREIEKNIDVIRKFNYRFVARTGNQYTTDHETTYKEKMDILAQSKIALVHGVLWCKGELLRAAWSTPHIEEHEAFSRIPKKTWYNWLWSFISQKEYLVPQLKTRIAESAAARALILYRRDPWNIIEQHFTPGEEFVYYEDGHLEEKIKEILTNWEQYEPIVEHAYQRVMREYTTQVFFEKYLKNLA